jgi:hypothetical protein
VAVILRSLGKELRDGLVGAIQEKDKTAGETITNLMIVWEDIPQVTDRSLQTALRGIDARKLALAFHKAEETIIRKIRAPSRAKAKVIVYSLPNRSEIHPHMILEKALVMPVRVAVKGTMAKPHTFASATLSDLAIWERFPVVISPPVQTKRNMR